MRRGQKMEPKALGEGSRKRVLTQMESNLRPCANNILENGHTP